MARGGNQTVRHQDLLTLVRDYLAVQGAWQAKLISTGMQRAGLPDIVACLEGRFLGLEIKSGTGKLSFKQEVERTAILRAGGLYVVCRSIEDVEAALLAAGLVAAPVLGPVGRARGP